MPATTLTPPPTDAPATRPSRVGLTVAAVLVAAWIAWLAWLTIQSANPPVVNRVQILASDLILVGRWHDRAAGRFDVIRELKHSEVTGTIAIQNVPPPHGSAGLDTEWIIPVRQTRNAYTVTAGKFVNRPQHDGKVVAPEVVVAPHIYPATPDVLEMIDAILNP